MVWVFLEPKLVNSDSGLELIDIQNKTKKKKIDNSAFFKMDEEKKGPFPSKLLRVFFLKKEKPFLKYNQNIKNSKKEFAREYAMKYFDLDTAITHQSSKNKLAFFAALKKAADNLGLTYDAEEALQYVGPYLNNKRKESNFLFLFLFSKESDLFFSL